MDLELTNKRAIVTGGSRGIGLAVARALAGGFHRALLAGSIFLVAAARSAESLSPRLPRMLTPPRMPSRVRPRKPRRMPSGHCGPSASPMTISLGLIAFSIAPNRARSA